MRELISKYSNHEIAYFHIVNLIEIKLPNALINYQIAKPAFLQD